MPSFRVIGPGRAGRSLAGALQGRGWTLSGFLGRHDDPRTAAVDVDLCVIATPDGAVASTAVKVATQSSTVVVHLSGALGLDVLAPHERRASIHPLVPLPDAERGAVALTGGAWFAVAGDSLARSVVADLGGQVVEVDDQSRVAYHAAACIASNHVVALLAQAERVAATAGVPLAAYLDLVRATVDNVAALGARAALTGPAARGDWATIAAHLDGLRPKEQGVYVEMAAAAARLAGHSWPAWLPTPIEARGELLAPVEARAGLPAPVEARAGR
jgi:predicted short-subunit dehydrogenase-like oxidoreductase (DUF2520 family)